MVFRHCFEVLIYITSVGKLPHTCFLPHFGGNFLTFVGRFFISEEASSLSEEASSLLEEASSLSENHVKTVIVLAVWNVVFPGQVFLHVTVVFHACE